jgi:glycolate oxidase FAD binding subunit
MEFALSELSAQVMTARAAQRPLSIRGGASKRFYGEATDLEGLRSHAVLDMSGYRGIVNYQPSELVITARAGTLLSEVEAALAEKNQMLAFEPPRFAASSTLGGCVASGLSGPRRMAAGSLRDFLLGAKLLDSSGIVLEFGGEVMKNVAGYDVSRLLAGSMGIFGPLVEMSLKVAPKPFEEATVVLEASEADALTLLNRWRGQPLPISATCWQEAGNGGQLWVRVSGSQSAVTSGLQKIEGAAVDETQARAFWNSLRDQTHAFFQSRPLWRIAVPPKTPPLNLGPTLIEWNGGQRWLGATLPAAELRARVAQCGGHASLFRYDSKPSGIPVFHPLADGLMDISRRLKQALDPVGIFNPKRLFSEF